MNGNKLKTIDIGHSGLSPEGAQSLLETTISQTSFEGNIRAIKVITGHGTGALRKLVRQWCAEQEGRFKQLYMAKIIICSTKMLRTCGPIATYQKILDFGRNNRAVTYIWLCRIYGT